MVIDSGEDSTRRSNYPHKFMKRIKKNKQNNNDVQMDGVNCLPKPRGATFWLFDRIRAHEKERKK